MQFANILLLGATLSAPVAHAIIAFTQTPGSVQAGVATLIKWSGGDTDQSTTITLKNGDSDDLQYVDTIAKNLHTTNFTWTPSSSLANGDYALQIEQGNDQPNYSGMFSLSGGSKKATTVASSSSPATTSSSSSLSKSSSASTTVTKTTPLAALPIGTSNSTTAAPKNATAPNTVLLGTGVGTGASSAGTGTALHRNTTMSKPTLSSTKSSSTAKSTSATTTSSETSSSSSGSASAAATGAAAVMRVGSPVAFVVSVMAAVVYLG